MSRPPRCIPADFVVHVVNRTVARVRIFLDARDYEAFESVLASGVRRLRTRLLAFCVMPNHFHLVLWSRTDTDISRLLAWVTSLHAQKWHADHETTGTGHVYQGRFRSSLVQAERHLLNVIAYVERNAARAKLVSDAADWRFGSLWHRLNDGSRLGGLLHAWPIPMPNDWRAFVARPESPETLEAIRRAAQAQHPLGSEEWRARVAKALGRRKRARGRPRKKLADPDGV